MFERAAIFSALLVLIMFCGISFKYSEKLGLEPISLTIQKQIGLK